MDNINSTQSTFEKEEYLNSKYDSLVDPMETITSSNTNISKTDNVSEVVSILTDDKSVKSQESLLYNFSENSKSQNNETELEPKDIVQNSYLDNLSKNTDKEKVVNQTSTRSQLIKPRKFLTTDKYNSTDAKSNDLNNLLIEVTHTLDTMREALNTYIENQKRTLSNDDVLKNKVIHLKNSSKSANEKNKENDNVANSKSSKKHKTIKSTTVDREYVKPVTKHSKRTSKRSWPRSRTRHLSMCPMYEPSTYDNLKENYYDAVNEFVRLQEEAKSINSHENTVGDKVQIVANLIDEINWKLDDPEYECESNICHLLRERRHIKPKSKNLAKISFSEKKLKAPSKNKSFRNYQVKYSEAATSTEYRDNFKDPRILCNSNMKSAKKVSTTGPNYMTSLTVQQKRKSDPNLKPFPAKDFLFYSNYEKEIEKRRKYEANQHFDSVEDIDICTCAFIEEYYRQHGCSYINHQGHIIVIDCPSDSDDNSSQSSFLYED